MFHIPIVQTDDPAAQIEFSHIHMDAEAGKWKKEDKICLDNMKINVFMEGDFSVIIDDKCFRPAYGDLCVLAPYRMHCGQIVKPTHTDYYQLDLGVKALDCVTGGRELMERLADNSANGGVFLRPEKKAVSRAIQLCSSLEAAIGEGELPLAYAYTIQLLSAIKTVYEQGGQASYFVLSSITQGTIRYMETHYGSRITVEELAGKFGVSRSYLTRLFKQEVGTSVHEYLMKYRALQASYLLKDHSSSDVGYMCGFSDSSHFISVFKRYFGCTPSAYKLRCRAKQK